jgi:hypothetical protein
MCPSELLVSQLWFQILISVLGSAIVALLFFRSRSARIKAFLTLVMLPLLALVVIHEPKQPLADNDAVDKKASPESYTRPSLNLLENEEHNAHTPDEAGLLKSMLGRVQAIAALAWPDKGQVYTPISLWNRIDGAAEVYKRYGLRRALFATAQSHGNDIEIQLFHLGSSVNAAAYFVYATKDSQGQALEQAGDQAVLWEGGGELATGSVYAKVILTSGLDIDDVKDSPRVILQALAGQAKKTVPVAPNTHAELLGLEPRVVAHYGVESVKVAGTVRSIVFKDMAHAAAFLSVIRPKGATKRLYEFGFETPGEAALCQGKLVYWATGKNAKDDVVRQRAKYSGPHLPGVHTLRNCDELLVQLNGWGGRANLGPTTVCRFSDGRELLVALANDKVWAQFKGSFEKVKQLTPILFSANDPYVGLVYFSHKKGRLAGAVGYEKVSEARKILEELLAE